MKKILTLILVLGMASMASAALQISVHNNPPGGETWDPMNPAPTDITIAPSDFLLLDIWTNADVVAGEGTPNEGDWVLYCMDTCGTISGGSIMYSSADWDLVVYGDAVGNGVPEMVGTNGVAGGHFGWAGAIPAGTVIYDEILFHCNDPGDCVIILQAVTSSWVALGEIMDQVTIHQIPEPMTMAILGLGGLALIRRRK
jgi:hypothetical protein